MANPLTLVLDLKPEVNLRDIGELIEKFHGKIDDGLKKVGTVHFARFIVLDPSRPNLLPSTNSNGPFKLAVITSYDGDFDAYISDFANRLEAVFDVLLLKCVGGESLVPVRRHIQEFTKFLAAGDASQNQPNSAFQLYSAYPYTVQQILAAGIG